jgi:hypothetical protein
VFRIDPIFFAAQVRDRDRWLIAHV